MRKKRCRQCKALFTPARPSTAVCSLACSIPYGRTMAAKEADKAHRARKRALKENDRAWQLKKCQEAFNKYIRTRDSNLPCISCGRFHQGQYHAGHYRSTKAQPALRFNEINVAKQCMPCNAHLSGNISEYRVELIRRIGIELVEWLEQDHGTLKLTLEEIKALRKYYDNATKELLHHDVESDTVPF